ncbi:MAG: DUF3368 domain-containing protein [Thermodesulfovibrionales bacterium]
MIAVSNTSPLILLDKIGHLWILGKLFQHVIVSPAVNAEWLRPGGYKTPEWLEVKTLSPEAKQSSIDLSEKIDKGEAEAIALFPFMKAGFLLLDDLKGRQTAKSLGFPVVGTVGLLVSVRQKGIIDNLPAAFEALQNHKFYITDEVLKKALALGYEEKADF